MTRQILIDNLHPYFGLVIIEVTELLLPKSVTFYGYFRYINTFFFHKYRYGFPLVSIMYLYGLSGFILWRLSDSHTPLHLPNILRMSQFLIITNNGNEH